MMQHLTSLVQVHHVCNTFYNPLRSKLYWFVVVTSLVMLTYFSVFQRGLDIAYVVYTMLGIFVVC
jgi:hypothetical protein